MFGPECHCRSALPTIRRPGGRAGVCSGLLRLCAFLLALVVAINVVHASPPPQLGQAAPVSAAPAPTPADDPCRPSHCCTQECALSCAPGAFAIAPATAPVGLDRAGGANPIARSDVNRGSGDPLPLFHPPKLLPLA